MLKDGGRWEGSCGKHGVHQEDEGKNKTTKRCRICNKPGHLAKDCWQGSKGPVGKKVPKGYAERPGSSDSGGKITELVSCVERSVISQRNATTKLINPLKKMITPRKGSSMVVVMVVVSLSCIQRVPKPIKIVTQRMRTVMSGTCLRRSKRTPINSIQKIACQHYMMNH